MDVQRHGLVGTPAQHDRLAAIERECRERERAEQGFRRLFEAAPDAAKLPQAPAASKVPEMVLPTKKEPLKPTPSKASPTHG